MGTEALYVIITRSKSFLVEQPLLIDTVLPYLAKKSIGIMNQEMDKVLYFNHIGSFQKGIYQEYPKTRERKAGTHLKVHIDVSASEMATTTAREALGDLLANISKEFQKDYGGNMEELWIDLNLVERWPALPFRFQKRVSIPYFSGNSVARYVYNVGHYRFVPDFDVLRYLQTPEEIRQYILESLYDSTAILEKRAKSLGNFQATEFRQDLLQACKKWMS